MAGNQVTLTFAGDSSQLERTFQRVGSGTREMNSELGRGARAFDRVGESADNAETRFSGLASGIDGVTTVMSADSPQEYAQGLADMADGIANFAVPALKNMVTQLLATGRAAVVSSAQHVASAAKTVAAWVLMGVQSMVNAAKMAAAWLISLGPIGLVIAAVGAVIAILVSLGVGFDDLKRWAKTAWDFILGIIKGVFNWLKTNWPLVLAILTGPFGLAVLAINRHWTTIKNGATAVKNWIVTQWNNLVTFVTGLPGRMSSALSGLWDGIKSGFKSAINAVIRMWNGFSISFGGYDIPGPGPNIPSFTIDTPNIPYLHTGGVFKAPPGSREGLAMLLDGERVMRPGQSAAPSVTINVYGSVLSERELIGKVRDELIRGGFGGLRWAS